MDSVTGSMSRQMQTAALNSRRLAAKLSIVSQPSYFTSRSAASTSVHGTWPLPGVPRSFSLICTYFSCFPMPRMAFPKCLSSMLEWNVSYDTPTRGWLTSAKSLAASADVFRK